MDESRIKSLLNALRNFIMFQFRYPWVKTGANVHCQLSARFWSPRKDIRIGDNVGIGYDCLFQADTHIGNHVMIASYCGFVNSDDHIYDVVGKTMWDSGHGYAMRIVIEDDVWIGHGVTILTPVRIGRGSIIAAGSVVTQDVAPYSIMAGVPARLVKMRFNPEQILQHETLLTASSFKHTKVE